MLGFALHKDKVLLIRKERPDWQAGRLNGIGGKLEGLETPLEGMQREFYEEAGRRVSDWVQFATMDFPEATVFCFMASLDAADAWNVYSKTDESIHWALIDSLPGGCLPNVYWLVPMAWHFIPIDREIAVVTFSKSDDPKLKG